MSQVSVAEADLSARAAQVLYAYAAAVDEGDLATLETLAHPDVAITRGGITKDGRDEFLAVYRGFAASGVRAARHVITNVRAYSQGDGTVLVEAYFTAIMLDQEGSRLVVGRYSDSLRDDGDGLRFSHKRILADGFVPMDTSVGWLGVTPLP